MTYVELKAKLIALMKTIYPVTEYEYYSMIVEEEYERPSFFTYLQPLEISGDNYNTMHHLLAFNIEYRQESLSEEDILEKVYQLEYLFGLSVKVGERAVDVTSYSWDYIGSGRNIAQITVNLEWSEKIERKETETLMQVVQVNRTIEMEE